MSTALRPITDGSKARSFDVVCAGEALWNVVATSASASAPTFRPGGGAVSAALALARQGLHVGLATVLADDTAGRALRDEIAGAEVDAGGVELSKPTSGLFLVEGGARQVVSFREEEQPVEIPPGWSSQVLLLSGMSPVVSHAAALCKAARAARRAGTIVVVDVNARWQLWKGRDARAIRMILREADVVWSSAEDLFGLNMDLASMRSAMRPNAVLAVSDGMGKASAIGPFGEVTRSATTVDLARDGDAFAIAICAELARAPTNLLSGDSWARALERGHDAMKARR
jgi:sugar/nucleoside kinase (ribokinase family)